MTTATPAPKTLTDLPAIGASGTDWPSALAFVLPVTNSLECGVLLLEEGRIVLASEPLSTMFGIAPAAIMAMSVEAFLDHVARQVDDPPERLRDRRMLPSDGTIVCEEFELARPGRSVVRWVARKIQSPAPVQIIVCTDITAEVDLTSAFERLAVTDRLTGVANRRGGEHILRRELARLKRQNEPLSVVLFDIDRFKAINDTHGHAVGDRVLRAVATTITRELRGADAVARWGGEEFLVILPSSEALAARACAERIRTAIAALAVRPGLDVTLSGGIAQVAAGEQMADAIRRADACLYEAKASGRNQVR